MSKVLADQHTRSAPHPQKHAPQEATHAWHALHVCKQASLVRHPSFSVDNTHTHTRSPGACAPSKSRRTTSWQEHEQEGQPGGRVLTCTPGVWWGGGEGNQGHGRAAKHFVADPAHPPLRAPRALS